MPDTFYRVRLTVSDEGSAVVEKFARNYGTLATNLKHVESAAKSAKKALDSVFGSADTKAEKYLKSLFNIQAMTQQLHASSLGAGNAIKTAFGDVGAKSIKLVNDYSDRTQNNFKSITNAAREVGATAPAAFRATSVAANATGMSIKGALAELMLFVAPIRMLINGLKYFRDYREQVNLTQAATGAYGAELEAMTAQQIDLAKTLGVTTLQSAEAQNILGKRGIETNDVLAATPKLIKFASVSQMDFASATESALQIGAQFKIQTKDIGVVLDTMAVAAITSAGDIKTMTSALENVGSIANFAGVEFKEVAATLSMFSNQGLVSAEAGTALKVAISRLANPIGGAKKALTDMFGEDFKKKLYEANGDLKDLTYVFGELSKRGMSTQQVFEIFGTKSAKVAAAFDGNVAAVNAYMESLTKATGAVDALQQIQDKGIVGATKRIWAMGTAITSVLGMIFEPALERISIGLAEVLKWTLNWFDAFRKSGISQEIAHIGGQLLRSFGEGKSAIDELFGAIKSGASWAWDILKAGGKILDDIQESLLGMKVVDFSSATESVEKLFETMRKGLPAVKEMLANFRANRMIEEWSLKAQIMIGAVGIRFSQLWSDAKIYALQFGDWFKQAIAWLFTIGVAPYFETFAKYFDLVAKIAPYLETALKHIILFGKLVATALNESIGKALDDVVNGFQKTMAKLGKDMLHTADGIDSEGMFRGAKESLTDFARSVHKTAYEWGDGLDSVKERNQAIEATATSLFASVHNLEAPFLKTGDAVRRFNKTMADAINDSPEVAAAIARIRNENNGLEKSLDPLLIKLKNLRAEQAAGHREALDRAANPPAVPGAGAQPPGAALPSVPGVQLPGLGATIQDALKGAGAVDPQIAAMQQRTEAVRAQVTAQEGILGSFRETQAKADEAFAAIDAARRTRDGQLMLGKTAAYKAAEEQLQRAKNKVLIQGTVSLFSALAGMAQDGNSKIFKIAKAFAIADALVNTYKAVSGALSSPPYPPYTIPMAAAALVNGMNQVRAIKSTNPGGGGGGGGGGSLSGGGVSIGGMGGGGAIPTSTIPTTTTPTAPTEAARPTRIVEITIAGDIIGDAQFVRERILPMMKDALRDNEDAGVEFVLGGA